MRSLGSFGSQSSILLIFAGISSLKISYRRMKTRYLASFLWFLSVPTKPHSSVVGSHLEWMTRSESPSWMHVMGDFLDMLIGSHLCRLFGVSSHLTAKVWAEVTFPFRLAGSDSMKVWYSILSQSISMDVIFASLSNFLRIFLRNSGLHSKHSQLIQGWASGSQSFLLKALPTSLTSNSISFNSGIWRCLIHHQKIVLRTCCHPKFAVKVFWWLVFIVFPRPWLPHYQLPVFQSQLRQ